MSHSTQDLPQVAGKNVVLAGTFDNIGRMEARLGLAKLGAKVVKDLDESVDFVAAKGGPKLDQALAMGITQIDEPTLAALLTQGDALKKATVADDAGPRLPKVNGAVIIIAGTLEVMTRQAAKRKLERLGAVVTDKLDGGVSFVVAGDKGGPTLFNAKQIGIPQINEPTLLELVAQLPEDEEQSALADGPPVLAGAVVALAGVPSAMGRQQVLRKLKKIGATVADRVDRNVKLVLVCQGGASTLFQAKELGIREVDEATLMELLAGVEEDAPNDAATGPGVEDLAGKKLLIAGTLREVSRVEAKRTLTRLGAEVVDQLSDDVAYVVAGEDGGRNLFLAKQADLPIIEEPLLLTLLAQAPEAAEEAEAAAPTPETLAGLRLVIAGKLPRVDRLEAKRKLLSMGAQVVDEVDADIACVFAGERGGRNVLLATQKKLPVFDEAALVDLLAQIPEVAPDADADVAQHLPDLRGRTVLLTGKLQRIERRDALKKLRQIGATLMDRVEDRPDYVIAGQRGGRAVFLAKQESIPVLDEETLLTILENAAADSVTPPDEDNG
jgi:NAD-dependent DNA ligase